MLPGRGRMLGRSTEPSMKPAVTTEMMVASSRTSKNGEGVQTGIVRPAGQEAATRGRAHERKEETVKAVPVRCSVQVIVIDVHAHKVGSDILKERPCR